MLDLNHTTDEGVSNAVNSSAFLWGLIKFTNAMLKPKDFVEDYLDVTNNGGIAALDAKEEYQESKNNAKIVDDKQMKVIEEKFYKYLMSIKALS